MKLRNVFASLGLLTLAAGTAFAQPAIKKVEASYTSPIDAKASFTQYCAVCHGTLGKGDGPAASALKKAPTDLTQLAKKNSGKFPTSRVAQYISGDETVASHGSRDMPIWGQIFHSMDSQNKSVEELRVKNLVDYVKTLQAP